MTEQAEVWRPLEEEWTELKRMSLARPLTPEEEQSYRAIFFSGARAFEKVMEMATETGQADSDEAGAAILNAVAEELEEFYEELEEIVRNGG